MKVNERHSFATSPSQMLVLAVCVFLLAVLWCVVYWRPRRRLWAMARHFPGPKTVPLLGNSGLFWGTQFDSFNALKSLHVNYGPVYRVWFAEHLAIGLQDAEDIEKVLGNTSVRNREGIMTRAGVPVFGISLFTSRDEEWRLHRKLIVPLFHFKILDSYMEMFGQHADILVEKLTRLAGQSSFDINDVLALCSLDSVFNSFSIDS